MQIRVARGLTYSLRITLAVCICTFAASTAAYSDTHYVSKTGSNTYPYTSWATATDSVRAAIDAADEWDTVLVGPGEFTADSLPIKRGLAFIGSGMDSTRITHNGTYLAFMPIWDSVLIEGFHFQGRVDTVATTLTYRMFKTVIANIENWAVIRANRFSDFQYGIVIVSTGPKQMLVEGNTFETFYKAIDAIGSDMVIRDNTFLVDRSDIAPVVDHLGRTAIVEKNTFLRTVEYSFPLIELQHCDSVAIRNNIFISQIWAPGISIRNNAGHPEYTTVGAIEQNLCYGSEVGIWSYGGSPTIRNNIVIGTELVALYYDSASTPPGYVGYNLYWNNQHAWGAGDFALLPDPGNLYALPMFLDSLDYHLQAFSPAINSGDPSILDVDGSRSDIGPFGGPLGESYEYVDLPPVTPIGLVASQSDSGLYLAWRGNHEADLYYYEVYRDTAPVTAPNPALLLAVVHADSHFVDLSVNPGQTYFYRLRAVDSLLQSSSLSDEVFHSVTHVDDDTPSRPQQLELHPNYPNPFNTATRIPFTIASGGAPGGKTLLTVYDVMGRRVRVLLSASMSPGRHDLVWDGRGSNGNTLASGVYFVELRTPGQVLIRRVLLLK